MRKEGIGDAAKNEMKATELLESLLLNEGAVAFGTADAGPVDDEEFRHFEAWLAEGCHGEMTYLEKHKELRRDPRLLLEGAKTVISAAFNYRQPNPLKGVAVYALGEDYHKVLRRRLKRVVAEMKTNFGGEWRICVDSATVLERYWSQKCRVGLRSPLH